MPYEKRSILQAVFSSSGQSFKSDCSREDDEPSRIGSD